MAAGCCDCQDAEYRSLHSQLSREVLLLPAQLHNSTVSVVFFYLMSLPSPLSVCLMFINTRLQNHQLYVKWNVKPRHSLTYVY